MSKLTSRISRTALTAILAATMGAGTSCMTTYDSYGRPVQSVDPALAIAGVAAAGIIGASVIGHHHHGGGYYRSYPRYYGGHSYHRGPRHYGYR